MTFDTDALAQITAIRSNLATCRQTLALERSAFEAEVQSVCAGRADEDLLLKDIDAVAVSTRQLSNRNGLYLQGKEQDHLSGMRLLHTRTALSLEQAFARGLCRKHAELTGPDAVEIARDGIEELHWPPTFASARQRFEEIDLAYRPNPIWFCEPNSAVPPAEQEIGLLPARLGLAPSGKRYVLLEVLGAKCRSARFADSGAYPYWRPGGVTVPIEQCEAGRSGLAETVSGELRIGALTVHLKEYDRTI